MERTVTFKMEKETKGAVKYAELDDNGNVVDYADALSGTLYLRKSALQGAVPSEIKVTVSW